MKIVKFNDIPHFQIFGSEDSKDYDIIVIVESISKNVDECSQICKKYDANISNFLNDKPINSNLGSIKNGYITDVFRGTPDEVNNALFYTYDLHDQLNSNIIIGPVKRDLDLKILRSTRGILSFFSRTELRPLIKSSLKSDIKSRLDVLKKIDFQKMDEFPGKKESKQDIYKVLAFQFGQIFSMIDGFEKDSYTKSGIIRSYPNLCNFLQRKKINGSDLIVLNEFNNRFIKLIESRIDKIGDIKEF